MYKFWEQDSQHAWFQYVKYAKLFGQLLWKLSGKQNLSHANTALLTQNATNMTLRQVDTNAKWYMSKPHIRMPKTLSGCQEPIHIIEA